MPRLWPAVGVAAGVGMESKYTIGTLLVALIVGFASRISEVCCAPRSWVAAAVRARDAPAASPGSITTGGRASASLPASTRRPRTTRRSHCTSPARRCSSPPALRWPSSAACGCGGARRCGRSRGLPALVTAGFAIEQGRRTTRCRPWPSASPPGRWLGTLATRRALEAAGLLVALVAVQLVVVAVAAPLVVPVRSTAGMIDSGLWKDSFYKDEIGWPELVTQTAEAWHTLPAAERSHAAILAENYGEAGALARLRPAARATAPALGPSELAVLARTAVASADRCHCRLRPGRPANPLLPVFTHSPRSTITGASTTRSAAASSRSATCGSHWGCCGRAASHETEL